MISILRILYKTTLWIFLGICIVIPVLHVRENTVSTISLVFYIVSGILGWYLLLPYPFPTPTVKKSDIVFLIGIILFHLGTLAVLSNVPVHFHFDEFIVAFTSVTLPSLQHINWFGVFPGRWVAQFPLLFFILQKPFLMVSPNIWGVRISTWPYSIGIILYLYWLSGTFFNRQFARFAVLLHVLFAPTLYINSMGLHFISSEFFYIAAITHFMLYVTTKSKTHLLPLSLYTTASYLTYTSSYATFPMILLLTIAALFRIKHQKLQMGFYLGKSFLVAFILFAPFLTLQFVRTPFMTVRTDQVNLFNGTWGDTQEQLKTGASYVTIITKQTTTALKSLLLPDIGGAGGYEYGKQPLFHPLAAFVFIIGLILMLFCIRGRKQRFGFALLAATIIPFILGFILTVPPPPFHRITLIYPFISLISAFPIYLLFNYLRKRPTLLKSFIVPLVVFTYGVFTLFQINTMNRRDQNIVTWDTPRISDYIKKHFPPNTPIYIAADPLFHYQFELPFRLGKAYPIVLKEKKTMLAVYPGRAPLIIAGASNENVALVKERFPNISVFTQLEKFPLKDVQLLIPESNN
jgi:hypothetical protein